MAVRLNLKNYYKKSYGEQIENVFGDDRRKRDLLKVKKLYKRDDTKVVNSLLKKLLKPKKTFYKNYDTGWYGYSKRALDLSQRCISKFRFGNNKAAHKNFIKLYMPQLNKDDIKEKPILFGDDVAEYEANMTAKHFKFIISPESQNVDLKVLAESFITQFNKLHNLDVRWLAVQHNDTAHKHIHLVINGVDKNGVEINKINKNFIKYTMREMLSRLCTVQVGQRTQEEIKKQRNKIYEKPRLTYLDEKIKGQITKNKNVFYPYKITSLNDNVNRRLLFLQTLNLAKQIGKTYFLKSDWYETLKIAGRYNMFLKVKNEYLHSGKPIKLFTNKDNAKLKGVVRKIYNMDDEQIWQNGFVLETEKSIYYVPSYYKVNTKHLGREVEIEADNRNKSVVKIKLIKTTEHTKKAQKNKEHGTLS